LQVGGEVEWSVEVAGYGGVDSEGVDEVHGGVGDGAEDEGWHADVPADGMRAAEGVQEVFLRVVEIGFDGYAWVVLFLGGCRGAEVDAGTLLGIDG
jgi:hypothetical protein